MGTPENIQRFRQAGKEWAKKLAAALNSDYRRFL
jgi:hypothetical protein